MSTAFTNTVVYTRGRIEGDKLTRALVQAAADGLRPHCSDPPSRHLWLSEFEGERREAARLCGGCPVFRPCDQAAEARQERFGVWGGRDRTRRQKGSARV
jgi:Transcription factor WhiB